MEEEEFDPYTASRSKAFFISSKEAVFGRDVAFGVKSAEDGDLAVCSAAASSSKRVRQVESESGPFPKWDVRLWSTLDDHLVEKIVARLPFKFLFQASALSKTWSLKFLSSSFQSEVHCSTPTWKSYSPLFVNNKKEVIGYESDSQRWQRLPSHGYLPEFMLQEWCWCLRAIGGSLWCWTTANRPPLGCKCGHLNPIYQVFVSNPLTKSWKQLPDRPDMCFPEVVHVDCQGGKDYQVILVSLKFTRGKRSISVQSFDSTSGSWTVSLYNIAKASNSNFDLEWGGSAYIGGFVYLVGTGPGYNLISFHVETNVWKENPHLCLVQDDKDLSVQELEDSQPSGFYNVRFSELVVCGSDVMLIVLHRDKLNLLELELLDSDDSSDDDAPQHPRCAPATLSVYRLNLESGLAYEVSRAPNEMLVVVDVCSAAGQGDRIYIGGRFLSCRSMVYDLKAKEWYWLPSARDQVGSFRDSRTLTWTPATYQPGLNPFFVV